MADSRLSPLFRWKFFLAALWLIMTLSMAAWWMVLGLQQIETMIELSGSFTEQLSRQKKMLLWEGVAWMVLLIAGGFTLLYLVYQEEKRNRSLREFFAAFSHDLKTSMASLKLQGESLKEDLEGRSSPVLDRLISDTVRLELQLENSLFLANRSQHKLYFESLSLRKLLQSLEYEWPQLKIQLKGDAALRVDQRAIESVLKNLIQNSVVHGRATVVSFSVRRSGAQRVFVDYADNGRGFSGDRQQLSQLFYRHNPSSGSGVGLYIVRQLMARMRGRIEFPLEAEEGGFRVQLEFEGNLL